MDHSGYVTCYVCNKSIPRAHFQKHTESTIHKCNASIMDVALERSRNVVKSNNVHLNTNQTTNHNDTEYDNLNISDKYKLCVYEEILPKICVLFKDAERNLDVLHDMRRILNKLDMVPVQNSLTKTGDGKTYCDICKVYKSNIGFEGHLKSKTHKSNAAASVSGTVNDSKRSEDPETTYCNLCDVYKRTSAFRCHLISKTHLNNCKANNVQLPTIEGLKCCEICLLYLREKLYDTHINSNSHRAKIVNDQDKYIEVGDNIICKICRVEIHADVDLKQHFISTMHYTKYINMINNNNITKVGCEYFCSKCENFFDNIIEHLEIHGVLGDLDEFCDVCNVRVPSGGIEVHQIGKNHAKNMEKAKDNIENFINVDLTGLMIHKQLTIRFKTLVCAVCNVPLSDVDVEKHFEDAVHMANMLLFAGKNSLEPASDNSYFCKLCNTYVGRWYSYDHIIEEHNCIVK